MQDASTTAAYGIREREQDGDALDFHIERLRTIGYSVLDSGMSRQDVDCLGTSLDAILERQLLEFGGMERLLLINDAHTARCPLVYDDAFLKLVRHPTLLRLCRQVLGEYVQLMQQNGVINPPGENHPQRAYHRDLPYQHFVSSRPLALSALFCIDPFCVETGATTVLPASHLNERFPSDDVAASLETAIEAAPGAFIVFDSMLFHRAGVNGSGGRGGLLTTCSRCRSSPSRSRSGGAAGSIRGRCRTGAAPGLWRGAAGSVAEWRERRLARATGNRT